MPHAKPVLMAVDDDPVALDRLRDELRRRYGSDYDVSCHASPGAALSELEATHERGEPVALVLADQSLGPTSGCELLAEVRALHPRSKRGLLIEFGAWGEQRMATAIRSAIALGDVDYYVVKPWRCPDETFHGSVSEFLREWAGSESSVPREMVLVADGMSRRCHELCSLLARNGIPHAFHTPDSPGGERLLRDAGLEGTTEPVAFLLDGEVLVDPSNAELARAYGATTDLEARDYDLVVVGAGPAGLAAAVYASSEGLRALVVERESIGGQAGSSSRIRNYLGFSRGVTGAELAQRAYQQAWVFGASFLLMRDAAELRTGDDGRHVLGIPGAGEVRASAVVLATGVTYRRLDIPALENLVNAGVYYGASPSQMYAFAGQHVFVVGGGNSAGQAALHLARSAKQVSLVVRGKGLAATMSQYLRDELAATSNVDVRLETQVVDGSGDDRLENLTLSDARSGARTVEPAAALFVLIGAQPNTEWLPRALERDELGYVRTGNDLLTEGAWELDRPPFMYEASVPGVFAVGDVRAGSTKRVASAVGEGSVVMQQVGAYLGPVGARV